MNKNHLVIGVLGVLVVVVVGMLGAEAFSNLKKPAVTPAQEQTQPAQAEPKYSPPPPPTPSTPSAMRSRRNALR